MLDVENAVMILFLRKIG